MARMTGGQALVKSLLAHGIDTLFALPGVQMDHFFNAVHDEANRLHVVHTRHEQAAAYLAHGYAQASGKVGAFAVVPGPGILNTTAALSTSYACNTPVLALSGQIPANAIGRGFGMLHEVPDQLNMLRGVVKWAERIEHPAEAPDRVAEAFKQLRTGRPRPVELEMAMDMLALESEVALLDPVTEHVRPAPDPDLIAEAAKMLGAASAPMIVVGGGAVAASESVRAVAEMLQAPVLSHRLGRGVMSDRHYLSVTMPAGHRLWHKSDVILAIGTRLQIPRMSWGTDPEQKIIHIDVDPVELTRISKPAVALLADADDALRLLADALPKHMDRRSAREEELTALKADVTKDLEQRLAPQMAYLAALRQALPDDGIFVEELTQVGYISRMAFPVYEPRQFLSSGYQGTLGAGFATALGAKVAFPDKPVLSINGDGGFMYNVQELATAARHNIGLVSVVFDDGAFGNVRRMQEELYDGKVIASDLTNPDFVKLAESFGVGAYRADGPDELAAAIERAFAEGGPALIHVPVGKMPDPWSIILARGRYQAE